MNLDRTQSARDLHDRAAAALAASQLGEANAMIRLAIRQNPDDPAARLLDAQIQIRRNLPEFAIAALDVRDQLDPDGAHDPRVALLRAEALAAAAFDDLAEGLLRQLVVTMPGDARPHRMLAGIYMKRREGRRAAEHLRQVQRLDPADNATRRLLAQMLEKVDRRAAVEVAMVGPPDPAGRLRTARMCRQTDRLRDAAELYTQLLHEQPDDAALWLEAGTLADELGESDLAIERLRRAAELDNKHRPAAFDALAVVHMHCGRFAAAATAWWRVTRLAPEHARPWAGLWLCAQCAGRRTLVDRARRRLENRSDAAQRCAILADLWPHVAVARAANAHDRDPSSASPLVELTAAAAAVLDRTAARHVYRADVHFHRAICQHLLGHVADAAASLDAALSINPNYAAAQNLRATLQNPAA